MSPGVSGHGESIPPTPGSRGPHLGVVFDRPMQIAQVQLEDLVALRRNEQELDRYAFLETVSFLTVGYFCVSTEIRFIIQLKDEISSFNNFDIAEKTLESELWHSKSLELACSFLPSDCPLLNHVLLSYQKHHAPS